MMWRDIAASSKNLSHLSMKYYEPDLSEILIMELWDNIISYFLKWQALLKIDTWSSFEKV